jgi:2-keto-4-pentenoate hydratase/2-oxohepta-3-ene-1,7-dioic acid hydratase in catechol pathway
MKLVVGESVFAAQRVFCIGQNYAEHVREMKGEIPEAPVIFCKPWTCLVAPGERIRFPKHGEELHHEVEVVVLIGKEGRAAAVEEASSFIAGLTLGLDLTLRDLQRGLREKGLPWEIAKGFEQSAPVGSFTPVKKLRNLSDIEFGCKVNGEVRQHSNTSDMIFPIERLVVEISKIWRLLPGDLIFTGTPSGVGPLRVGDGVEIESPALGAFSWEVV